MRAGIQPCDPSPQELDPELPAREVEPVEVRDLQLPSRGRLQAAGKLQYLIVIKVDSRHRIL